MVMWISQLRRQTEIIRLPFPHDSEEEATGASVQQICPTCPGPFLTQQGEKQGAHLGNTVLPPLMENLFVYIDVSTVLV